MDMQNVSNLQIPEGAVRTIHGKNNRLLWGRVAYDTKYAGDTLQNGTPTPDAPIPVQTVTGAQTVTIGDGVSSQSYEINLGKNLFDINGTSGAFRANKTISGQTITSTATATVTGYVAIVIPNSDNLLGKECSISFSAQASIGIARFRIAEGASTNPSSVGSVIKTIVGNGSKTETFTFPASYGTGKDCFVVLLYPHTDDSTWSVGDYATFTNIQLELGSATTYAPYFEPVELCKIGNYQDYIYKSGDDWYVHRTCDRVTFNGTENWQKNDANVVFTLADAIDYMRDGTAPVSDNFFGQSEVTSFARMEDNRIGFLQSAANNRTIIKYTTIASVSAFKTWLSSHNTTVYYPLATATDTQITDATLIGQLNAVYEWLTRYGYSSTATGNLPIVINKTNL